jgi:hypothetical protein
MLSLAVLFLLLSISSSSNLRRSSHLNKPYIKSADEGLHFSSILPTPEEWRKTFKDKVSDQRVSMEYSQPLILWMKCIDDELRGYFSFERTDPDPHCGQMGVEMLINANTMHNNVKLLVDGSPVSYMSDIGGQAFKANISSVTTSHVVVSIEGWVRYTAFPLSDCQQSSDFDNPVKIGQPRNPKLVIIANTPDTFNISQKSLFTRMVSNHLLYHRCALGIQGYEVIVQHDHIDKYLQNPQLRHFFDLGWITLVTKPFRPARRQLPKDYIWQSLYENLAILRHWKKDVYLLNFDPDEYLVYSADRFTNSSQFRDLIFSHSNLVIDRYNTHCLTGCKHDRIDGAISFTSPRTYGKDKMLTLERYPKIIYDVEKNSCSYVHYMTCRTGDDIRLDNNTAYMLHFENLLLFREKTNFTEKNDLLEAVDLNHPLLKICNPAHPDAKIMKY